jgi:hypothetical protein
MLLAILLHPFMLGIVYPVLVIGGIVALLLPEQDEIAYEFKDYKPAPVDTSEIAQLLPVVKRYNYAPNYVKNQGSPIGDELERQMIARVIAYTFLDELARKAHQRERAAQMAFNKNNLVLCARREHVIL